MWDLCAIRVKSRRESVDSEKTERSSLPYDELCQRVRQNQEQYTVAKTEHADKKSVQFAEAAYKFGRTIEQLLNDFPELLGPAQALDNQYGGVVFPAVSLLWKLVSSKKRYEEHMQQQLDGFKELYRSRGDGQTDKEAKDLQDLLKPVFEGIANFLNASATYYQRSYLPTTRPIRRLNLKSEHGYTRFRRATVSSDEPDLDKIRSLVQRAQEEIAVLLSTDARETRITTLRITEQCAELKKRLRAQDDQGLADRLSHLKRLLNISGFSEQQVKMQFEKNLRWTFEINKKKVPRYQDALKFLEKDAAFVAWRNSESSAVLVLSGHSSGTLSSQRFCWLSAAAMEFINLMKESDCPVAYFNGQIGGTFSDGQTRSTDQDALHHLIGQIAGWDPCCLQTTDHEQHIRNGDWDHDNVKGKTKLLQALLDSYSAAEPVYLVFDNVNMGSEPSTRFPTRPRPVLVKRMVELVRDVQGVVKILFIGLDADFDEVEIDILRETVTDLGREQLLSRLRWDSATLRRFP
ncbi:MAG: hypothetical protein Q9166_006781 [cf. Caloplaca sp. 2 TL-2023]